MAEEKIKRAPTISVYTTAGLTSVYQLVDKTPSDSFSFQEHEGTSVAPDVRLIYRPSPSYEAQEMGGRTE